MPDFHFVCSPSEELRLVNALLDEDYIILQHNGSESKSPKPIKGVASYKSLRIKITQWHIAHRAFTLKPLNVEYAPKARIPGYFIHHRDGGPTILLDIFVEDDQFAKSESNILGVAMLHHYPWYWDWEKEEPFDAPDELKRRYKEIVKRIKKGSKCYKLVGTRTWIGPEAETMLRSGWKINNPDADRDFREQIKERS